MSFELCKRGFAQVIHIAVTEKLCINLWIMWISLLKLWGIYGAEI